MPAAVVLQQDKHTGRVCGRRRENDVHLRQWNWTGMSPAATWDQTAVSAGVGIPRSSLSALIPGPQVLVQKGWAARSPPIVPVVPSRSFHPSPLEGENPASPTRPLAALRAGPSPGRRVGTRSSTWSWFSTPRASVSWFTGQEGRQRRPAVC